MIRIDKVNAQIAIKTNNAQNKVTLKNADFEMSQTHVKVQIQTEQIKVKIDQTQCFNESGLMNNTALLESAAAEGRNAAAQAIDKIVSDGNMMAEIRKGSDAIAEISAADTFHTIDFNIDVMPKSRPQIDFVGGNVDIKISDGEIRLNTKANKPDMEYTPGNVEIQLQQKPHISFSYTGEKIDLKG